MTFSKIATQAKAGPASLGAGELPASLHWDSNLASGPRSLSMDEGVGGDFARRQRQWNP